MSKLTDKQKEKRAEMIENAIQYFMNGWNISKSEKNSMSRDEAVCLVESMLSNSKNLEVFNALAALFSK